jgi:hypothetical protein
MKHKSQALKLRPESDSVQMHARVWFFGVLGREGLPGPLHKADGTHLQFETRYPTSIQGQSSDPHPEMYLYPGSCEHSNEPSVSIKGRVFLD